MKAYLWGTSQRQDGQMSVYSGDEASTNRRKFFEKIGLDSERVVLAGLSHGNRVAVVGEEDIGQKIDDTDGLVTAAPDVILSITSADCLPVFFFDKGKEIIGLAHAGWRGVENNIVSQMVDKMVLDFGSRPEELMVEIGPHIKSCHFEVKDDLVGKFSKYENSIIKENGVIKLDLSAIVKEQLKEVGVRTDNINIGEECTYCLVDKYYSFRRDQPKKVEVMISYSVIKN